AGNASAHQGALGLLKRIIWKLDDGFPEPHQRAASRSGDGPHQLQPLLGEPVPRADDGGGLRADAGAAPEGAADRLLPSSDLYSARALDQARCSGGHLRATDRSAPARLIPSPRRLEPNRWRLGRASGITSA